MEKIVVLSHEAGMSADDIVARIKTLTGIEFTTTTDKENNKVVEYGCSIWETNSVCLCVGNGEPWCLNLSYSGLIRGIKPYIRLVLELTVSSVKYDKRIFKPGELVVELTCTCNKEDYKLTNTVVTSALKSALYDSTNKKRSTIYFLGYTGDDNGTDKDALIDVCSKYYVHDFTVTSNNGSIKVVLNCYSPDKLLTLDKYSKVYCGDTFNSMLFNHMKNQPTDLELNYDVKNITNARTYGEADDKISEIRFPFLVQYNESYYDFLRRIAVRCGEYLFHEDGKLTLGIPEHTAPNNVLDTSGINVKYPHVTLSDTNDTEVKLVTNAIIPTQEEREKLKDAKKDKKDDENKESFPSYNMEYTNDDFQKVVGKKDNDTIYDGMYAWEKFTYGALGAALTKATNAETAVSALLTADLSAIADAGINRLYLKDDFEEEAEKYADSVGLLPSGGLMNSVYYEIEKNEEKAQKNTVELDYSSTIPNMKLGKAVNLDDDLADFYTVTHVYGEITSDNVRRNMVEIVPTTKMVKTYTKKVTIKDGNKEEEKEEKVSITIIASIPPHYDIPRIRKAEAQEAVVRDVKDPYLLGRVRVQFMWQIDKDKENIKIYLDGEEQEIERTNFSPWLRVTVPYVGGNKGGMNMMPEEDDHLMVNFVGGNVDMPYIEGFMATCATMPSSGSGLIKNRLSPSFQRKVIASSKGHSITFTDIDDKSSIFNMICPPVAAVWNIVQGIGKQFAEWTDPLPMDEHFAPFTGGITLRDPNGVYELDLSAKTRSINVKSPFGNVNISAFTGITIDAPNGDINIRGKNVSIEAGNNVSIVSGTNIRGAKDDRETVMKSVGGAMATMAMGVAWNSITSALPWAKEITKLTDLSFLRSTWEIIIRPVEGSLKLQSKRNTIITAGKGRAAVPSENLSDAKVLGEKKNGKVGFVEFNSEQNQVSLDIVALIDALKNAHDNCYDTYRKNMEKISRNINDIIDKLGSIQGSLNDNFKNDIALSVRNNCYNKIYRKIMVGEELAKWDTVLNALNNHSSVKTKYNDCAKLLRKAIGAYKDIRDKYKKDYEDSIKKAIKRNTNVNVDLKTNFVENLWTNTTMFNVDIAQDEIANTIVTKLQEDGYKKKSRRKLIYQFVTESLRDYLKLTPNANYIYDDTDDDEDVLWVAWLTHLKSNQGLLKTESNQLGGLVDKLTLGITNFAQSGFYNDPFKTGFAGKLLNAHGIAGPRSVWGLQQEGQVLITNKYAKTMRINNDGNGWESYYPNLYDDEDIDTIQTKLSTL